MTRTQLKKSPSPSLVLEHSIRYRGASTQQGGCCLYDVHFLCSQTYSNHDFAVTRMPGCGLQLVVLFL